MVNEINFGTKLIPFEVANNFFSFLTPSQLCNIVTVCKQWQSLTEKDSLWEPLVYNLQNPNTIADLLHKNVIFTYKSLFKTETERNNKRNAENLVVSAMSTPF